MDKSIVYSTTAAIITATVIIIAVIALTDREQACRERLARSTDRDIESIIAICGGK